MVEANKCTFLKDVGVAEINDHMSQMNSEGWSLISATVTLNKYGVRTHYFFWKT